MSVFRNKSSTLFVLLSLLLLVGPWLSVAHRHEANGVGVYKIHQRPKNDDDILKPVCGQDLVWNLRKQLLNISKADCTMSKCDDPSVRDNTPIAPKVINIRFHVMLGPQGEWPTGLTESNLLNGIEAFQEDFSVLSINFHVTDITYHRDSRFFCLPAYGEPNWLSEAEAMKEKYAVTPDQEFNVFVACMDPGSNGRLNGYGCFPWDPEALTAQGGVFMNSIVMSPAYTTLTHEFGHNIGLWHTFHGQAEVTCPGDCAEPPHQPGDPVADNQGDFCSDTLAAPRYWDCSPPTESSCTRAPWVLSDGIWENIMSYSSCRTHFTEQQAKRAHCFLCNELKSIVSGCP